MGRLCVILGSEVFVVQCNARDEALSNEPGIWLLAAWKCDVEEDVKVTVHGRNYAHVPDLQSLQLIIVRKLGIELWSS